AMVYVDSNMNWVRDAGEPFATSGPDGAYELQLPATTGTFRIVADDLAGYSKDTQGWNVTAHPSGRTSIDFWFVPTSPHIVTGYAYRDDDGNGQFSLHEALSIGAMVYVD